MPSARFSLPDDARLLVQSIKDRVPGVLSCTILETALDQGLAIIDQALKCGRPVDVQLAYTVECLQHIQENNHADLLRNNPGTG